MKGRINLHRRYCWKFEVTNYDKGTFLLGLNFNSNDEWGRDERESYVCIYLWKKCITVGKFH